MCPFKSKKSSTELFIIITIMVIVIVLLVIFRTGKSQSMIVEEMGHVMRSTVNQELKSTVTELPYVTINGISLEELMGVYTCYGNDAADYGNNLDFNIWDEIRKKLDLIYGPGRWALQLEQTSMGPAIEFVFVFDSSGSITQDGRPTDLQKMERVRDIISPTSKLWPIDHLGKIDSASTDCHHGTSGPGASASQKESWGQAVEYICLNGPPSEGPPGSFVPWSQDQVPAIFFISDEYSCSCSGQGSDISPTQHYVDDAIAACTDPDGNPATADGITVFYLLPDTILTWPDSKSGCPDPQSVFDEGTRLAEGTGGKAIDIEDANRAVEEIKQIIDIPEGRTFVTSTVIINEVDIPEEIEVISYPFIFPLPCTEAKVGRAILYRWLE